MDERRCRGVTVGRAARLARAVRPAAWLDTGRVVTAAAGGGGGRAALAGALRPGGDQTVCPAAPPAASCMGRGCRS
ncbi:hypothetical protein G6F65_022205 [Rhizopus arrhizus]|nr:hypothetical protein G6F65_022205 [Rhizopus arrhizus]